MARVSAEKSGQTKFELLEAARLVLVSEGFAGLSTRRVAEAADTQMSQIRYHFGSKEGMILALFEYMNAQLIDRQAALFNDPALSIADKWALACDYLEEDLTSGYVRVLQELIAAGWANEAIGEAVRAAMTQWHGLLSGLAREFEQRHGALGPFSPQDVAALTASAFIGAEAFLLLRYENRDRPIRQALRKIGDVIAHYENSAVEN